MHSRSKTNDTKRCQSIIWSILTGNSQSDVLASARFIEVLRTAERCGDLNPQMKVLATSYKAHAEMDQPGILVELQKVIPSNTEKEKQRELVAIDTLNHYHYWTKEVCLSECNIINWCYYQTVERAERTLATIGIASLFFKAKRVPSYFQNSKKWIYDSWKN